ncbi:acyltransferase [Paraclostridium bifermentans]|uniref:acyltransferase n=1 Tax=Paraclostridium bifermentans TaxID=1490 RepID=UPI0011DD4D10|nr:acyltransferase [Paraclostridium bifermentans]
MIKKIIRSYYRTKKFKQIGVSTIVKKGEFYHTGKLEVGSYCYIGPGASISANGGLKIGKGTIIGPKTSIYTSNHNYKLNLNSIPYDSLTIEKEVVIGEGCWIGGNVIVAPGTKIGKGVIVAAGETVRGNVPEYSIYINGEAKKKRDNIEEYNKLYSKEIFYMKKKLEKYETISQYLKVFFKNIKTEDL